MQIPSFSLFVSSTHLPSSFFPPVAKKTMQSFLQENCVLVECTEFTDDFFRSIQELAGSFSFGWKQNPPNVLFRLTNQHLDFLELIAPIPLYSHFYQSLLQQLSGVLHEKPCWAFRNQTFSFPTNSPYLMGILNATPDSFSDGGLFQHPQKAVAKALQMEEEGAHFIDIGGESTRPGSNFVSEKEELQRVLPIIETLSKKLTIPISIDTSKAEVARQAVLAGAELVNDVSGLRFSPSMASVVSANKAFLILMHSRHTPKEMQKEPFYRCFWSEIQKELELSVKKAIDAGISPQQIMLDPGIGFGKRQEDNLSLLHHCERFQTMGFPVLLGASRKSFLGKIAQTTDAQQRLEGSLAVASIAWHKKIDVLRVHDVKETSRFLQVLNAIQGNQYP